MLKPELSPELRLQLPDSYFYPQSLSQVPSLLFMPADWRKVFVKAQAVARSVNMGQKFPHQPQMLLAPHLS